MERILQGPHPAGGAIQHKMGEDVAWKKRAASSVSNASVRNEKKKKKRCKKKQNWHWSNQTRFTFRKPLGCVVVPDTNAIIRRVQKKVFAWGVRLTQFQKFSVLGLFMSWFLVVRISGTWLQRLSILSCRRKDLLQHQQSLSTVDKMVIFS